MTNFLKFLCVFILTSYSCKNQEKLPDTYTEKFYDCETKVNDLVKSLKSDTLLANKYGETFDWTKFNDTTKQKLKNLGILEVHVFSWGGRQMQFDFKTNWRAATPIHLCYNTRDSIESKKGFYRKDQNSNEVWGLGRSWTLWNEIKLIDAVQ